MGIMRIFIHKRNGQFSKEEIKEILNNHLFNIENFIRTLLQNNLDNLNLPLNFQLRFKTVNSSPDTIELEVYLTTQNDYEQIDIPDIPPLRFFT
jgi:hypothetical protein